MNGGPHLPKVVVSNGRLLFLDNLSVSHSAMRLVRKTPTEHEIKVLSQQVLRPYARNITATESVDVTMNQAFKKFFI